MPDLPLAPAGNFLVSSVLSLIGKADEWHAPSGDKCTFNRNYTPKFGALLADRAQAESRISR